MDRNLLHYHIYSAVRCAKLDELKILLAEHEEIIEEHKLLSISRNCTTLLISACLVGSLDIVLYLIEHCNLDVNQVGTCYGLNEEKITPLCLAAFLGHLDIVKVLVEHKASVTDVTDIRKSTPLHTACYKNHVEVFKYLLEHEVDIEARNSLGETCLMIACRKGFYDIAEALLKSGADLDKKNAEGITVVDKCIESGRLAMLQLLLKYGAQIDTDTFGSASLILAADYGRTSMVVYLVLEHNYTNQTKANALELLGATVIDKDDNFELALQLWLLAMFLRYDADNDSPLDKPFFKSAMASFMDAQEVCTFEELHELLDDPDEMCIQALIIRERILGPNDYSTLYFIISRSEMYYHAETFQRYFQLCLYALDIQQQKVATPFHAMTLERISELTKFLSDYVLQNYPETFQNTLHVFERLVKELNKALEVLTFEVCKTNDHFENCQDSAMILFGFMSCMRLGLTESEEAKVKQIASQCVKLSLPSLPLHRTCNIILPFTICLNKSQGKPYSALKAVEVLLEAHADPNAVDVDRNTPLHIAAQTDDCPDHVLKLLLDHGAHIDLPNSDNKTALEFMSDYKIYPLQYLNLQCLCAQVINAHKIPYKGIVHTEMNNFLQSHCLH